MARLLIAGLLAAASVTPLLAQGQVPPAQPVPAPPVAMPAPLAPMAPMAMRAPMTRSDVQARVQRQFAMRDSNRDGALTADELNAGGRRMMVIRRPDGVARPQGAPGGRRAMADPNAAFDRLDANRDGSISRDEFARGRQVRVERIVIDRAGQPGAKRAMRGMRRGGGAMGAALLKNADANRDGRVTLAEATGAALQRFDRIDANRDGRITPDERGNARVRVRQMRNAG